MELDNFLNEASTVKKVKASKVAAIQKPIALDMDEDDDDEINKAGKEDDGNEENINNDNGNDANVNDDNGDNGDNDNDENEDDDDDNSSDDQLNVGKIAPRKTQSVARYTQFGRVST